jgi:hypothetical protein
MFSLLLNCWRIDATLRAELAREYLGSVTFWQGTERTVIARYERGGGMANTRCGCK